MTYQTQPGTLPHRAVEFLKAKPPGAEVSTAELGAALGLEDSNVVVPCLVHVRRHGVLKARAHPLDKRRLLWSLGDGRPEGPPPDVAAYDARIDEQGKPGRPAKPATFRTLMWDGRLLATGMEIRDGVAIFTPEQVLAIKRQTDWAVIA